MKSRAHAGVLMNDDRPPLSPKGGPQEKKILGTEPQEALLWHCVCPKSPPLPFSHLSFSFVGISPLPCLQIFQFFSLSPVAHLRIL